MNLEYDLADRMRNESLPEVESLSSYSYVDEVEDVTINQITELDDGIRVQGECKAFVHIEFDGDDMGDDHYPSTFDVVMQEDEKGRYFIGDGDCHFHVQTY